MASYTFVNTEDYVPYAQLRWPNSSAVIEIDYLSGSYRVEIKGEDNESRRLVEKTEAVFDVERHEDSISFTVPSHEISPTVNKIARFAQS